MILWQLLYTNTGRSLCACVRARALINATDMIDKFRNHRWIPRSLEPEHSLFKVGRDQISPAAFRLFPDSLLSGRENVGFSRVR